MFDVWKNKNPTQTGPKRWLMLVLYLFIGIAVLAVYAFMGDIMHFIGSLF